MKAYQSLDELLAELPGLAAQARDKLRGHDGLFLIELKEGRRVWLRLLDGELIVSDSASGAPDCTVRADGETVLRLMAGELSPMRALVTRRVTARGDVGRLTRLIQLML